ncbi:MAG: MG2 domain-containing protein [Cyanobacteriota bacterium]|nr:MG2 domain-containing protein [Cyanobacteriota bacterium]
MLGRWLLALLLLLGLGSAVIMAEPPRGSLSGQVVLAADQPAADIQAIAYGPVVRGVHVGKDGRFTIRQLPQGSYRVRATAQGYESTVIQEQVRVKEGQQLELPATSLTALTPALYFSFTSQVFTRQEEPQINLRASGIESVQLQLARFQIQDYLGSDELRELADPYGYGLMEGITAQPIRTWQQPLPIGEDAWSAITLDLPDLEVGSYTLRAQANLETEKPLTAGLIFTITDLGLIQKQASDRMVVEAVDLATLQPIPNVEVRVYGQDDLTQPPLRATTDASGLTQILIPQQRRDQSQFLVYGRLAEQNWEALASSYYYGGSTDQYSIYTYTDRPLYRPGQTVYFRSILRRLDGQGSLVPVPAGSTVEVQVTTPRGDPLPPQTLTVSRFGTVHGEVALPADGELGSYELIIKAEAATSYAFVRVEEYRKPEFDVSVTTDQSWVKQGSAVEVSARANYLFGGPVAQAQVHYTVYRSPDWGFRYQVLPRSAAADFFGNELDRERGYDYGGYGSLILEGDTITDDTGLARFRLANLLKDFEWQGSEEDYFGSAPVQQLRIEVEVTDISRRSVSRDARLRVTQGSAALFVEGDQYVAAAGDPLTYRIRSYGYDQQPVSIRSGNLRIEEWLWEAKQNRYQKQRTLLTSPFRTEGGEGSVSLNLPSDLPNGNYRVIVEARDSQGGMMQDQTSIWVTQADASGFRWAGPQQGIQVIPDREVYQVGDTAHLLVVSPLPDAYALLTVEGVTIYQAQVKKLAGNVAKIDLPILENYRPNVFYGVTLLGSQRQIYQGEAVIRVSPLDRFLQVEVTSDRQVYQPGETAQIQISTRDAQGLPIPAEVSLGVVDSALYILREDPTPDIRRFFYQQRYNRVNTAYSFPQQYPAGLDKLANQVRQNFRDTAAWFPTIVTDSQGLATVPVPLPDNLTTWRLTARATTAATQVGSARHTLQVSKDLLVRLATPRFLSTGDQLSVTAIVQNQTDQPQTVNVQLETPSTLQPLTAPSQRISLPPQGSQRLVWPTQVLAAGATTVRVIAQADQLQDAVQLTIPAQPLGRDWRFHESRSLLAGSQTQTISLSLPDSVVPGSLVLQIDWASNPLASLLGSLDYLVDYPYGCTEQTLSRFLPALAIDQARSALGLTLQSSTLERLSQVVQQGIRRLQESQNSDGGWGWWRYDRSNPYLTSYVLLGYRQAAEAGYGEAIIPEQVERGLAYLQTQVAAPPNRDNALDADMQVFAEYILALYEQGSLPRLTGIPTDQLSTLGIAYRSLAALALADRQLAQASFDQVWVSAQLNSGYRWFQQASQVLGIRPLWLRPTYAGAEVAGPLLEAATLLRDQRASQLADWLLQQRQGSAWQTTKASADALMGLIRYTQTLSQQNPATYQVRLKNLQTGSILAEWQANPGQPRQTLRLTPRDLNSPLLRAGSQTLQLEKVGSGPLYASLDLQAFVPTPPTSPLPAESQGLAVTRRYFRLQAKPQRDGRILYEERPFSGTVAAGTTLMGKITLTSDQDHNYVMLEEPLASGVEVLSQDPRTLTDGGDPSRYGWDWFWTHQEIRDNRITFFATELPRGSHEFVYLFRPEIPGQFSIPPAHAEEMYNPAQVYGQSSSQSLTVTE